MADTEGDSLPGYDVKIFEAIGPITSQNMIQFEAILERKNIAVHWYNGGIDDAGYIKTEPRASADESPRRSLGMNVNHDPLVQFATLAHELGHLFLGHLRSDTQLKIPERPRLHDQQCEIEAEAVAFWFVIATA